MKLRQKVIAVVVVLTAFTIVAGVLSLRMVSSLRDGLLNNAVYTEMLLQQMNADMMHDALRADVLLAFSSSDPAFSSSLDDVKKDLKEHSDFLLNEFHALEQKNIDPDLAPIISSTKTPLEAYAKAANDIVAKVGSDPAQAKTGFADFMVAFSNLEKKMGELDEAITGKSSAAAQAGATSASQSISFAWIMMALAIVLGLAASFIMYAYVVRPITRVSADIERLAGGAANVTLYGLDRRDEIGLIAKALARFREKEMEAIATERGLVQSAIGAALERLAHRDLTYRMDHNLPAAYVTLQSNFNHAMEQLESVILSLIEHSGGIAVGTRDISQASHELSNRTETQAASLEETAAAVADITRKVNQTTESAVKTQEVATLAQDEVQKSGQVVGNAIAAMEQIEKSSNKITQIIGVIDEIAFQTNLLALNAGVEAARAGDEGRGFAVVAQEVRILAQRSAEAASEVKQLIGSALSQVEVGVKLVNETGQSLSHITSRIVDINALMGQVVSAAKEQSSALLQINQSVSEMDRSTQANASMVNSTSSATQGLMERFEGLNAMIDAFVTRQAAKRDTQHTPFSAAA